MVARRGYKTEGSRAQRRPLLRPLGRSRSGLVQRAGLTKLLVGASIMISLVGGLSLRAGADAICMDGTYSYAEGQGACSFHGGVQQWLLVDRGDPSTMGGPRPANPPGLLQPGSITPPSEPEPSWWSKNWWWVVGGGAFLLWGTNQQSGGNSKAP